MKRIASVFIAIVMILSLSCAVFADEFVPSIGEKGEPKLIGIELIENGEVVGSIEPECLLVTAISRVNLSEEIPDDAADLLLQVYKALRDGTSNLPVLENEELVIRDMLDISLVCEECAALLEKDGVSLKLTFDLGVAADAVVKAFTYKNDKWSAIANVTNNGDGTVTCTFEHLCPVAFAISTMNDAGNAGDAFRTELIVWTIAMVVSAAALVVVISRRKAVRA